MTKWPHTGREGRHPPPIARAWTRPPARACGARGCSRVLHRSRPDCSASNPMRGDGERLESGRLQAPAELGREEQVGELGCAVRDPRAVERRAATSSRRRTAHPVHVRADRDDARPRGRHDAVEEQPRQGEVSQVVRRHLQFEAVSRLAVGVPITPALFTRTSSRAWPASISSAARRTETRSARSRWSTSRDERSSSSLHLVAGPARLFVVPAGQDHVGSVLGQRPRRLVARSRCSLRSPAPPGP